AIFATASGPPTASSVDVSLTNSTVEGNSASFQGGGLMLQLFGRGGAVRASVTGSTFDGNTALSGGAINSFEQATTPTATATLTVTNSTLFGNSPVLGGGLTNTPPG